MARSVAHLLVLVGMLVVVTALSAWLTTPTHTHTLAVQGPGRRVSSTAIPSTSAMQLISSASGFAGSMHPSVTNQGIKQHGRRLLRWLQAERSHASPLGAAPSAMIDQTGQRMAGSWLSVGHPLCLISLENSCGAAMRVT